MANPKVSILCIAFNQASFIRQTLDSFLMQKTSFEIEILINDDASTDGTKEIIKEYQKKYPKIIKPVFQKDNQYSKGKRNFILRYLISKARGEYLALCEGDDYWTEPDKLQKQVDFLDSNPDYALCFHPVRVVYEDKSIEDSIFPSDNDISKFTVEELLKRNFIQTNSVMYRHAKYENVNLRVTPGDWYLHLYHARFGKIGFIDETMSVYRRHSGGIWWQARNDNERDEVWKKHGLAHIELYIELLKMYGETEAYKEPILKNLIGTINIFLRIDKEHSTNLLEQCLELIYKDKKIMLMVLEALLKSNFEELRNITRIFESSDTELKNTQAELNLIKEELAHIKSSKHYQYAVRAAKLKNRFKHSTKVEIDKEQ